MAYTTINKSSEHFNTVTYTGDGNATQAITNTFQTDFSWIKHRGTTAAHTLQDAVRGFSESKKLSSNSNDAENNASGATWGDYGGVSAVGATSFTVYKGSQTPYQTNESGANYVAWNWKANGAGSSNTDGSINTTYTSVNTTAGFSIGKYTGNGTSGATIGHGLGAIPRLIIVKRLDTTGSWQVLGNGLGQPGATSYGKLNSKDGFTSGSNRWNNTAPTTSVFSLGNSTEVNASGGTYVAYVWCNVPGYFKGGLYQGNGNANGTFVNTGGRPTLILLKPNIADKDWYLIDDKRGYNGSIKSFYPNANAAETDLGDYLDLHSNGFKIKTTDNSFNGWGNSYQYWCWMQTAVGSNNVPCTAR